jgi:hypothetical protein
MKTDLCPRVTTLPSVAVLEQAFMAAGQCVVVPGK